MRVIDTQAYVSSLRDLTQAGHEVCIRIAGGSMIPFLVDGRDTVKFKKPDKPLKVGDIVFFQRKDGRFVLHRIRKIKPEGYYIVGDGQTLVEGPVKEQQIFAVVTAAERKGKWIGPGDFWWEFFARVWIKIIAPRRLLIKGYSFFRNAGKSHSGKDIGK